MTKMIRTTLNPLCHSMEHRKATGVLFSCCSLRDASRSHTSTRRMSEFASVCTIRLMARNVPFQFPSLTQTATVNETERLTYQCRIQRSHSIPRLATLLAEGYENAKDTMSRTQADARAWHPKVGKASSHLKPISQVLIAAISILETASFFANMKGTT